MIEEKLRNALQNGRMEPPMGFEARSDHQLRTLIAKEEKQVKRFPMVAIVCLTVLCMATAVAAGIVTWQRGLEDKLRVTEEIKQTYEETELFQEPKLSVTDQGVTVTLEEYIVDKHAAFIAFRVSGYELPEGQQPAFDAVDYDAGITGANYVGNWSFYDGLMSGNDGKAVYLDGTPLLANQKAPYVGEDGDLMFIISMICNEDSYVGKTMHVKLENLGTYMDKYGTVKVDVPGSWEFEWVLEGSDLAISKENLSLPIGKSGSSLNGMRLSPVYVELDMTVPRNPEDTESTRHVPYLYGVKMKDGTVHAYITDGGMQGYLDFESEQFMMKYALDRIIIPQDVESLLFTSPLDTSGVLEVKMP